jgi:hypothetical protein
MTPINDVNRASRSPPLKLKRDTAGVSHIKPLKGLLGCTYIGKAVSDTALFNKRTLGMRMTRNEWFLRFGGSTILENTPENLAKLLSKDALLSLVVFVWSEFDRICPEEDYFAGTRWKEILPRVHLDASDSTCARSHLSGFGLLSPASLWDRATGTSIGASAAAMSGSMSTLLKLMTNVINADAAVGRRGEPKSWTRSATSSKRQNSAVSSSSQRRKRRFDDLTSAT